MQGTGEAQGHRVRLRNRRVGLGRDDGGNFVLHFKRLGEDRTIEEAGLSLTPDAMEALVGIYDRHYRPGRNEV